MKTIQSVARYFPDRCGGIQIRLSELIPILRVHGVESKIAAPRNNPQADTYNHGGVEVYRYPAFPRPKPEPNHGEFLHGGFEHFAKWLKNQKADIYHQHQWTPDCGLPHLRFAKELGMATVVSIRLPQPICLRHTLMLYGKEACDGKIDEVRCSRCCDDLARKLPTSIIQTLSQMPLSVLTRIPMPESVYAPASEKGTKGFLLRPFAVPAYVAARRRSLVEMAKFADRIVTLSEQLSKMLVLNGVPEEKLVICRTGIPDSFPTTPPKLKQRTNPLKVVFLGRWERTKGIHILVEAVKSLSADISIELTIYGIPFKEQYRQEILDRVANDQRIQIAQPLAREKLASVLATYDVLALPAQWFDVRPMVVLEAHASGLPVLGSNMGGIPELVRHGVDGLLLPPSDVKAWAEALAQLATDANLLDKLRQGIQPIRTIGMEAADTVAIYKSILAEPATRSTELQQVI